LQVKIILILQIVLWLTTKNNKNHCSFKSWNNSTALMSSIFSSAFFSILRRTSNSSFCRACLSTLPRKYSICRSSNCSCLVAFLFLLPWLKNKFPLHKILHQFVGVIPLFHQFLDWKITVLLMVYMYWNDTSFMKVCHDKSQCHLYRILYIFGGRSKFIS